MDEPKKTGEAGQEQPPPLRISRLLHAQRETVFKAWSSAEHVERWFAPDPCTVTGAVVEMRAGGTFDLCMHMPGGEGHWVRGTVIEVVPNARLVIEMRCLGGDGSPLFLAFTEVNFSDALGGTQIDIVQTYKLIDLSKGWMVAGAPEGWRSTLGKLEKEVIRMRGGTGVETRSAVHGTFSLTRTYDASVTRVWKALTEEQAKQKWFAGPPGRWELIERHMDVRTGGSERLKGRWEGGAVSAFAAFYHDVVDNERLVYSYVMYLGAKKISVSLATMELCGDGAKTTLKVTEQGAFLDGFDDAGSREQGTGHLLDALGASLLD